ncbi:alpha/beta hydrolase [Bradyrhizobium sacchari]|uniref:Pimeloyl-ACP methyl ester carboxylesterase n=1 Tax=Bradyrhizobium sacchari TaxID=1399419 RepID=A0A560KKW1_9BRAD|nr:alpha/beta hydrolase [Bradyrhizobium sacchari]OPZ00551.1 alpha/beta hydrolase [Bradyrhizobium sacchari]TWB65007.1 pimeloyl-ACP methyl ester carboxylesterase [Bradyrhizobium sacchari]TWB81330.1 pimeloyl-ACP methyl ester carboxylesterase [Bradyrhizobium sacchari]
MQFIASGRARLATEIVGDGTAIVFLHANVCDRRMWRAQLDAIGATRKAIAYDRRGFGETQAEPEDFSALADLVAVLDATAGGKPAILVGCSLGGRIALDAAIRHPSRVRALLLIAPNVAGAPDPTYTPDIEKLMTQSKEAEASGDLDRLNAMKARLWLDGPLAGEGRVTGPARDLLLDMNSIALRSPPFGSDVDIRPFFDRLSDIAVPTLVAWGDLDFPYVQDRCRHVAAVVPGAEGREMPGAAHLPSLERPAETTALISEFVARHAG